MATNTNPIPTKFTKGLAISNKTDSLLTEQGTVVVNPTTNKAEVYSGGAFRVLADDSQVVKNTGAQSIDGSLAVTGNVSGATPTQNSHLATKLYVDNKSGSQGVFNSYMTSSNYTIDSRSGIKDYYIHVLNNAADITLPGGTIEVGRTFVVTKHSANQVRLLVPPGSGFSMVLRDQQVIQVTLSWGLSVTWSGTDWFVTNVFN